MTWRIEKSDCIEFMRSLPADSVDLTIFSPQYCLARLYLENGEDLGIAREPEDWVAWMLEVFKESQRVCKGLICCVVAGNTKDFKWNAAPVLLAADLHRSGFNLRNPPVYHRVGIPGSGGPDWLRADTEMCICTTRPGKLPFSDNTAMGHAPKWAPGGAMSHRITAGQRVNQWGNVGGKKGMGNKDRAGEAEPTSRPSHKGRRVTRGSKDGDTMTSDSYQPPVLANPGAKIEEVYTASEVAEMMGQLHDWLDIKVGGGLMGGDVFSSRNEAPFSERLCEFFILSFSPPGGTVMDIFSGSGTSGAVAIRHGRNFLGSDIRQSQIDLGRKRLEQETPMALFNEVPK